MKSRARGSLLSIRTFSISVARPRIHARHVCFVITVSSPYLYLPQTLKRLTRSVHVLHCCTGEET